MGRLPFFNRKAANVPAETPAVAREMKSLTIEFNQPQIEINGIVFDLLKSDADIFEDAMKIVEKYKALDVTDETAVLDAIRTMVGYVDTILGPGAMKQISGGRPVGIVKAQECMIIIARAAADSYETSIREKYGD